MRAYSLRLQELLDEAISRREKAPIFSKRYSYYDRQVAIIQQAYNNSFHIETLYAVESHNLKAAISTGTSNTRTLSQI